MQEEHSLDKWLRRLSHLSQFGLFLFTVGTLYFTVLPLYQKALLDEAIARKEVELIQTNEALEKAYGQLRKSEIRMYIMGAGAECSGLLIPPAIPRLNASGPRESLAEQVFKINVRTCLEEVATARAIKQVLRLADYEFLMSKIQELSLRLEDKKRGATAEHDGLPERARLNPSSIPPPIGFTARAIELFEKAHDEANDRSSESRKLESKIVLEKKRFQAAISQARDGVVWTYSKDVQNEILALNKLQWP